MEDLSIFIIGVRIMTIVFSEGIEYTLRHGVTLLSCKLEYRYQDPAGDWVLQFKHPETGTVFRRMEKDLQKEDKKGPI